MNERRQQHHDEVMPQTQLCQSVAKKVMILTTGIRQGFMNSSPLQLRKIIHASLLNVHFVIVCILYLFVATTLSWSEPGRRGQAMVAVLAQEHATRRHRSPPRSIKLHNPAHESVVRNILQPRMIKEDTKSNSLKSGNHTSNVAVVVSSSRYWFNYRHVTNALSIYHLLKRGGITDDNIVLMLADDMPCNMRNPHRGKIYPRGIGKEDLMENAEVDYSGTDVTVDAFLRVLLGRHLPGEERNDGWAQELVGLHRHRRSLPTLDENTNLVVYLTGHGGDNFFKFQDGEELMSHDISSVFSQMYEAKRYNEVLFIADTCQAFTMADEIDAPNVFSVGSSLKGENSYASHSDVDVGQSVIDRYSKVIKDFIDDAVSLTKTTEVVTESEHSSHQNDNIPFNEATVAVMERLTLHDVLVRIPMNYGDLGPNSHVGHTDQLCSRSMNSVPLSDFFASAQVVRGRHHSNNLDKSGGVKTIIWMSNNTYITENVSPIPTMMNAKTNTEDECVADLDLPPYSVINISRESKTKENRKKGISPNDPQFVILVIVFVLGVTFTSRIW